MSRFPHFTPHAQLLAKASAQVHAGPIHLEGTALANMATLQRRADATSDLVLPKFSKLAVSINVGLYGADHMHVRRMLLRNQACNEVARHGFYIPMETVH